MSVGSTDHVVGVLDTGIDYTHPDLAPNLWSAPAAFTVDLGGGTIVTCAAGTFGFNAITRTCNPMDDHGHGTHVAGTIGAAGNNGLGVVGVNWTTRIMGIKSLDAGGSGTIADAIAAIRFAVGARRAFPGAADVRVLSASWGSFDFSQALLDEITATQSEEMLFVAAAGNYGLNNDAFPIYPASYAAVNVVSVAATTNTNLRAYFSNYGPATVHLGAPGLDILSTTPGSSYAFSSGTSMAAPHVSGAAALVLSRCPLATAALKDALVGTVQPMDALAALTISGGRLDVNSAIHSCIAPPPAPTLSAVGGDGEVRLSWNSATGATGYTIKRSLVAGGPYATIASAIKGARYTDITANGTTVYYVVSASNPLGASPDSNEASATPNAPSDLVVSAFTAPPAAGAGATIAVSMTTANQGGGPSAATITRIYLSSNAVFDAADPALEPAHAVPALAPGGTSTTAFNVTIPAGTSSGWHYLFAVADAERRVDETSEFNNTRSRLLTIGPDLVTSSLTVPAAAGAGATITVTDTVKNQGAGDAPPSATQFYLSANAVLDAGDPQLPGTRAVPALDAGGSSAGSTALTIPAGTAVGSYYLFAKADGAGAVVESSETNNILGRPILIGGDLRISSFSAPAKGGAGLSLVVSDTTVNQGTAGVEPSRTRFYLSSNALIDAGDTLFTAGRAVPALAPDAASTGTTVLTIPAGVPVGSYYLFAQADGDGTVTETQEANNTVLRGILIGPDLMIASLSVPAEAAPGATISVTDTTVNQGGGAAAASSTTFFLSGNFTLDAGDITLGGSRTVAPLAPGASSVGATSLTIPPATAAGTYYLIAKADEDGSVAETQEANNVRAAAVRIGADLAVSSASLPSSTVPAGSSAVISITVVNQGVGLAAASTARFYLSSNLTLDGSDILVSGSRDVAALATDVSSTGSTLITIPPGTAPGTYYVLVKADADDAVAESVETNNVRFVRTITVSAQ